jgi:hypothetical protein
MKSDSLLYMRIPEIPVVGTGELVIFVCDAEVEEMPVKRPIRLQNPIVKPAVNAYGRRALAKLCQRIAKTKVFSISLIGIANHVSPAKPVPI